MPRSNSEERRAYNRQYYAENRAKVREQQASYYRREIERVRQWHKTYRAQNRDLCNRRLRQWRAENPEQQLALSRKHYRENADKANAATKAWRARNHERYIGGRIKARRQRIHADPAFAMITRLRATLWQALKKQGARKVARTIHLIGCTAPQLAAHIESQFTAGMSWGNRRLWHIDHIRPCASFDLTDTEQQKACFHYTNLQPLWAADNRRKGARIQGEKTWLKRLN